MNPNTLIFLSVNDFARATPWLHGPLALYASDGIVIFAGLLVAGWWIARRHGDPSSMAAALWAPLGTLLAVAVNQPIVALVHEARPYESLSGILVLATPTTDPGFPSDHATMAGAVAAGLFLVNRRLGVVAALAALLMAVSRVYIAAHYPLDVAAGTAAGRRSHPRRVGPAASGADPGGRTGGGHPAPAAVGGGTRRIPVLRWSRNRTTRRSPHR